MNKRWQHKRPAPKGGRYHITLNEQAAQHLKRLGRGNLSEGIRQAAQFLRTLDHDFSPSPFDPVPRYLPPDEAAAKARELIDRWRKYFETRGESEPPEQLLKESYYFRYA